MKTFACGAGYASGGLGQHLAELVEEARGADELGAYYTRRPCAGDAAGIAIDEPWSRHLSRWTPIRLDPGRSAEIAFGFFDRAVARRIVPNTVHVGFGLQSLHTFRALRRAGDTELWLVSPTCHVDYVRERYAEAYRRHPIERSWLNDGQIRRAKLEYDLADRIVIASNYVRDSFVAAGFPESVFVRFDLSAGGRFVSGVRADDGVFRIVYVGSLSVAKGTPLLVEAFARLDIAESELWLVGGYGTRGMRRWLEVRCAHDPRIRIAPGDPLLHLQRADVYVHPSYQDGSPYAPLEALACGVPVVLSEDTGTKELIRPGENGWILPTGDVDALAEAIEEVHRSAPARIAS